MRTFTKLQKNPKKTSGIEVNHAGLSKPLFLNSRGCLFSVVLLLLVLNVNKSFASYTLTTPPTQIAAGTICAGGSNIPVYTLEMDGFIGSTTLTAFSFSTTGSTYTTSDVTNFRLYTNTTNSFATATLRGSAVASAPGAQSITVSPSLVFAATATIYVWITCDVAAAATAGHTVKVASATGTPAPAFNFSGAGNTQTIGTAPTAVTATLSGNPLCAAATLTLTGTATGGATYLWAGPAGGAAMTGTTTLITRINSVTTANSGIYTLTATNTCGSTVATTAILSVNQLPVFGTVSESPNPGCVGGTMALSATTTTTGVGAVYTWTGPGGTAITNPTSLTTASVNPLAAGNAGNYTITATAPGCAGSATKVSTAAMTVNQLPAFTGVTQSPNPGCVGGPMSLTATTSTTGAGPIAYTWTRPGGTAITNPNSLTTASVNALAAGNAGNYTITATVAGCAGSATGVSTTPMVVNQLPTFTGVLESPNPGCVGGSMTLIASGSAAGSGPIVYAWTGPGGTAISNPSSLTTASVNPLVAGNAGNYTITATVPGCVGSATGVSTTPMVVNAPPTSVLPTVAPSPACIGSLVNLTGNVTGGTSLTYAWTGPVTGHISSASSVDATIN